MSVMACGRAGCDHIMCDRLILNHSVYICDDCWRELLAHKATWPNEMTAVEVHEAIVAFMDRPPGSTVKLDKEGIDMWFRRFTR